MIVSIPSSNELECSGETPCNKFSESLPFTTETDNNNTNVAKENISNGTISDVTKQDERQCVIRKLDRPKREIKSNPNNEIGYEIHTLDCY